MALETSCQKRQRSDVHRLTLEIVKAFLVFANLILSLSHVRDPVPLKTSCIIETAVSFDEDSTPTLCFFEYEKTARKPSDQFLNVPYTIVQKCRMPF